MRRHTIQYFKDEDGYTAQVVQWPEVLACGKNFEECRRMIVSALKEMIVEYKSEKKPIPGSEAEAIFESLEIAGVG